MFERYTEKARRVIFFARYEASQFGSPYIETEHLLLGLLREDKALTNRFLRSHASVESIRKQIEGHTTIREKVSTSVDLPLSNECKRVLAYAAEEAERLSHKHIGTEHLLLGLLREEKCFAAEILHERGLRLSTIREELARTSQEKSAPQRGQRESSLLSEFSRDLTQSAMDNQLDPLVGRDNEVERVVQILCRRTKNNPVLIGEPGVGKTAIVEGLAQRIADGEVPSFLADKRILALDLSLIVAGTKYRGQFEERLKTIMKELMESQNSIIFIDELAHAGRRGIGRRLARRRQHPEAGPFARRNSVHRRHHARGIPQVDRKRPVARTPLPGREGSAAERSRRHQDSFRNQRTLRKIPRGHLHRRRHQFFGVAFEPLYSRPFPAR
jgi:ATP-dependent Clp protease ATP-binding subunit ClpC